MASKRKKSRPTKIAKETDLLENSGEYLERREEDPMTRIQRFIEEGSEDTPDACHERSKCSPTKQLASEKSFLLSTVQSDKSLNLALNGFPSIFTNGQIPANLKFHQLKTEEIESIETSSVNVVVPDVNEGDIFDSAVMKGNTFNEFDTDQRIGFTQGVAVPKKSPAKRAKPSDDDTPRYSCSTCKYVTNRSDHYKRHLMTHSAEKPLKCAMCSYGTGRSDHYKRHLQRHGLSEQEVIDTCFRNGLKLKNTSISLAMDCNSKPKELKENVQQPNQTNFSNNAPERNDFGRFKHKTCSFSTDECGLFNQRKNSGAKIDQVPSKKSHKTLSSPQQQQQRTGERAQRRCKECSLTFIDRPSLLRHLKNKHTEDLNTGEITDLIVTNLDSIKEETALHDITATAELAPEKSITSDIHVIEDSPEMRILTPDVREKSPSVISMPSETNSDMIFVGKGNEKNEDSSENSDDNQRTTRFMPSVPSTGANLGCTKCGNWFNKFNEYSSHTCVS